MFLGYLFTQFKFGGKGVAKEVIDTYRERQTQLEEQLKLAQEMTTKVTNDLKNEVQALRLDLASMQGQLIEKDKKLQEFTEIFQGKSPELIQILAEIRDFMKKLSTQSTTNQDRNVAIDKSTKENEGNVMRKK